MSLFYKQRLMTPGPTAVPEAVLLEMAEPIIHHRTKQFQAYFAELSERLRRVYKTEHPVLTIAGSGTTSFEAAQSSLIKPGQKAITIAGGKFGERWQDIYDVYGIEQIKVNVPWGDAVDVAEIEQLLKDNPDVAVVTVVHSETSTATASDVKALAEVVQKTDALLLVDGITAIGAMPFEMDAWGVDVAVTGSQKAMMLPPGLGFVGLGERALARLENKDSVAGYNLDLRRWVASYAKNDVPFTPPVSLVRGQVVALQMIEDFGVDETVTRTQTLAAGTRAAFQAMGLKLISSSPSDSVTGAYYPEGIVDSKFRGAMRDEYGIHIAGGQDGRGASWKGKIFRISHMGYVDAGDTLATLQALEAVFVAQGASIEVGKAIPAFQKVLAG